MGMDKGVLGWDTHLGETTVPLPSSPLRVGNVGSGIRIIHTHTLTYTHTLTRTDAHSHAGSVSVQASPWVFLTTTVLHGFLELS